MNKISYNKDDKCNEDEFAAKKENGYMFLNNPKFKLLDVKTTLDLALVMMLGASQWVVDCNS